MRIITKLANPSGAYPPMQEGMSILPEGFAIWPDTLDTAVFYEHNGFVLLTIEQVEGVDTVTAVEPNTAAWEEWKASLPPETDPEPTAEDRIAALESENKLLTQQVEALSGQMDFQEECIVEMAGIVYA